MGVDNLLLLQIVLFYQSTLSWLKVIGGGGVGGVAVLVHSLVILVSAQVLWVLTFD